MSFLSKKTQVTTSAPKYKPAETELERAAQLAALIAQPGWREISNALYAMRDGALAELRDAKGTYEADLQCLERWRATDSIVQRILDYPVSVSESAKEQE